MTDFHDAKRTAKADHAAWSAAERERLTKDPAAIGETIRTGAINNLTAQDREALIAQFGAAKPAPLMLPAQEAVREPSPLEPATKPVARRQSWQDGEFGHAARLAVILWAVALFGGLIILEILWNWEHI